MPNPLPSSRLAWIAAALALAACQDPIAPDAERQGGGATATNQGPGPVVPQPPARIAFVGNDSTGRPQVFTITRTGEGLTQLTNFTSGHIWDVEWSPGGASRLAFHTDEKIYVMAANGSGLQDLTPPGGRGVWGLVWSPDGTKLAVWDRTVGNGNPINLWVLNADGSGGLAHLASDVNWLSTPAWSPDGQRLMYYARTDSPRTASNDRGVYTIKPDGTGRTKVVDVTNSSFYWNFQYSPNGAKVVVCRDLQTLIMNPNGSGLTSLGVNCESSTGPQWSPNGARLVMALVLGNREQIFAVDPDGADKTQLTFGDISSDEAMWSRGNGFIAFRRGATGGTMDLWVMKADGSEKTQLTSGMSLENAVSWGPTPGYLGY